MFRVLTQASSWIAPIRNSVKYSALQCRARSHIQSHSQSPASSFMRTFTSPSTTEKNSSYASHEFEYSKSINSKKHQENIPPLPESLIPSLPFSRFIASTRTVSIIGAPFAAGQPISGVDLGPACIRQEGLIQRLEKDSWKVVERGDIKFDLAQPLSRDEHLVKSSTIVGGANHKIYKEVYKAACDSHFCLTLGGDHSIGIGSLSGVLHARPDSAVVWVDAHADINTPYTSSSGNAHGMVLSFLMNLANTRNIHGFEWLQQLPLLNPSRLVYIGLRDLDAGEKHILRALNIRTFTMHDVDKHGIGKVMEYALDHIIGRVARPVHLSLDIDSIDPIFAPSTGTRVAGGLSYREAYYVCEALAETKCLSSMDMVEVNPQLNQSGSAQTIQMAVGLISSALGNRIL